jgi:CheY-like chemotaxis protein
VYQTLHLKAEEKKLELGYTIDAAVPAWLKGDPTRLTQVLINLTGNAIKFTPEGGRVDVICKQEADADGTWLRFEVSDTGIGIAEDQLDKIFESFSQESSDTTRKFGGTGLGLTISRQLVELMGGSLQVSSVKGQGTTFWFRLPCRAGTAKKSETASTGSKLREHLTVLLAEDQPMNQMVAVDTLESLFPGITVDVADNGQIAVEKAAARPYDLIFMDVHMPVMDGYTATRNIRSGGGPNASTPILALTANAVKEEIDRCLESGMNRHLAKPFEPEKLRDMVTQLTSAE